MNAQGNGGDKMNAEKYIRVAAKIISVFADEELTFSEVSEVLTKVGETVRKTCVIGKTDYINTVKSSLTMGK